MQTPSAISLRPFRGFSAPQKIREEPVVTTFGFATPQTTNEESHIPMSTKDVFNNSLNIDAIKRWINDKLGDGETYPYILLVGGVGVGKSELLRLCFKECGCSVIEYDDELRSSSYEILKDSINMTNVETIFTMGGVRKLGIIIDNYQTTLIPLHRKEFITYLRNNKTSPVIFTSDTMANTTDLQRGKGLVLQFELPTIEQMVGLGRRIDSERREEEIVSLANSTYPDIRSFRNLLSCNVSRLKDLNMDIRDNIEYFFNNNFRDNLRQTSLFTSHIVQENYLDMCSKNIDMEKVWEMAEYCSMGDLVKESAFENQAWDYMNDIGNALGTLGPINVLRENRSKIVAKVPNRKVVIVPRYISEIRMSLLDVYYIFINLVGNVNMVEENLGEFFEFINGMDFDTALKILHLAYSFNNIAYKDIKRITSKLKKYYEANYSEDL